MLLNPVVPLTPVTVKETVVVVADWFVAIAMLVICELVMFPLIPISTFAPLVCLCRNIFCGCWGGSGIGFRCCGWS